jgi:hypothetical protein
MSTAPFPDVHFATFSDKTRGAMYLGRMSSGWHLLDPFSGTGTAGLVADLRLSRQSRSAGCCKRRFNRRFGFRQCRLDVDAGGNRVIAGVEAFQFGKNTAPAVFEIAAAARSA